MSDEAPRQFWLRNDKGKVWGPLQASTIQILLENNALPGRLQASTDGLSFAMIGRFEDLREYVPVELWGVDPAEIGVAGEAAPTEQKAGAGTGGPVAPTGAEPPRAPAP
ncbi:MAG: molecular chaperone DnaJ, partial [Myxococcota bacterium]